MKRVFSSILLVFRFPIKLLKRTKIDNFVGGLIFGSFFSLIVNVVTVGIQETIQKQHILESVESEIANNTARASALFQQTHDPNEPYNPFYTVGRYSRDIWEQSSEPLQYISQLDQETQIAITGYYITFIPLTNGSLDNMQRITDENLATCIDWEIKLSPEEIEKCNNWNNIRFDLEKSTALEVANQGLKVLKVFHPTKDRLNNWFLKLILGDQSTTLLSGE